PSVPGRVRRSCPRAGRWRQPSCPPGPYRVAGLQPGRQGPGQRQLPGGEGLGHADEGPQVQGQRLHRPRRGAGVRAGRQTGGGARSVDGAIKLIDPATGKVVADTKNGHSDTVYGLSFSPDGTRLASCGADRQIKIFEVPSGKLLKSFEGHTHHVLDIAWKADGKLLASAGADKVIKVWDCEKGEALRSFPGDKSGPKKNGPGGARPVKYTDEVARLAFVGDS